MESVVNQPLGDVSCLHAFFGLQFVAKYHFVHGRRRVGEIVSALHSFANVIGVEHGIFGGLAQAIRAIGENVGQSADEHSEVAVKGTHAADRQRSVVFKGQRAI